MSPTQRVSRDPGPALPPPERPFDKASIQDRVTELQAGIQPEENFKGLFEHYHGIMLRFFAKRGFTSEECQDLAQESFFRIHKNIDSYRGEGPFEGWLFQIAANVYRNRIRDQNAGKRWAHEDSLESFLVEVSGITDGSNPLGASGPSGPLEGYLEKERLKVLAIALGELPEQMRRCVILRIHQELKYREIAAVMRISIETVKAHLYQARRRLKHHLDGYFEILATDEPSGESG